MTNGHRTADTLLNYKINNELAASLELEENPDTSNVILRLVSKSGIVIDQKEITAYSKGEKIISATIDYENKKLILQQSDKGVVECDLSDIISKINSLDYKYDNTEEKLIELEANKLEASNLIAGPNIELEKVGNNITIGTSAEVSSVLTATLTANQTIGGVSAGRIFSKGTTIESIIREMFEGEPSNDWCVGFMTGLGKTDAKALTSADQVYQYVTSWYSSSNNLIYSFTSTDEITRGVLFVMYKSGLEFDSIVYTPGGTSGSTFVSSWTQAELDAEIASGVTQWIKISYTIDSDVYTLYGYFNNSWNPGDKFDFTLK